VCIDTNIASIKALKYILEKENMNSMYVIIHAKENLSKIHMLLSNLKRPLFKTMFIILYVAKYG